MSRLGETLLRIPGSNWPQSSGLPIGTGRVESFQVSREIVSSMLPGQVRAATGFSIGSASCSVGQPAGQPLTPYSTATSHRVTPGERAELFTIDRDGVESPLGAWQVADVAGDLTSGLMPVTLTEIQAGTKRHLMPLPIDPVDPIWIIDTLARQAGFYSTPPIVPGRTVSLPFAGGLAHEQSSSAPIFSSPPEWSMATGQPSLASASGLLVRTRIRRPYDHAYITFNLAGSCELGYGGEYSIEQLLIRVSGETFEVYDEATTGWVSGSFERGMCADWPLRVQCWLKTGPSGGVFEVCFRSGPDAAWSTPVSAVPGGVRESTPRLAVLDLQGGISGLQVTETADPALWAPATARLELFGGTIEKPMLNNPETTIWNGIREVCESFLGAAWVDRHGVLQARSKDGLAGVGQPRQTLDVSTHADDLKWSIATGDHADRLEVSWWPISPPEDPTELHEWPVGNSRIHVPAGRSFSRVVDLGGWTNYVAPFRHEMAPGDPDASTWEANTQADGQGTDITTGITVTLSRTSPGGVLVSVKNTTLTDVWMVDLNGDPALILRGSGVWQQDTQARIVHGVDEGSAKRPLEVDLGKLVQTSADAEALASWIWERVQKVRWRVQNMRVPFDPDLDIGKIYRLVHTPTDLLADVIVTRVQTSGRAGETTQTIDVALLNITVDAFDRIWRGTTVSEFDARWAGTTVAQFDRQPLQIGV